MTDILPVEKEYHNSILTTMQEHYHYHPLLPIRIQDEHLNLDRLQIWAKCTKEMYTFCKDKNLPAVFRYLWTNWYCEDKWGWWALSSKEDRIPLGRTTMLVESHWKVLKRDYLYKFVRPVGIILTACFGFVVNLSASQRMDFFIYVLVRQFIPRQVDSYRKILSGRTSAHWKEEFVKEWKKLIQNEINGNYQVNVVDWICSCPGYRQHKYHLCKHLIHRSVYLLHEARFPSDNAVNHSIADNIEFEPCCINYKSHAPHHSHIIRQTVAPFVRIMHVNATGAASSSYAPPKIPDDEVFDDTIEEEKSIAINCIAMDTTPAILTSSSAKLVGSDCKNLDEGQIFPIADASVETETEAKYPSQLYDSYELYDVDMGDVGEQDNDDQQRQTQANRQQRFDTVVALKELAKHLEDNLDNEKHVDRVLGWRKLGEVVTDVWNEIKSHRKARVRKPLKEMIRSVALYFRESDSELGKENYSHMKDTETRSPLQSPKIASAKKPLAPLQTSNMKGKDHHEKSIVRTTESKATRPSFPNLSIPKVQQHLTTSRSMENAVSCEFPDLNDGQKVLDAVCASTFIFDD